MSAVMFKRFSTKNHPDSYSLHGNAKEQLSFGQVRWQGDTRGDGTVLHHSAAGPAGNAKPGYDHQGSYNNEHTLMLTLRLVAKIAQEIA